MEFKQNLKNKENWKWIGKEMTLLGSSMSTRHVKHSSNLHFKLFVRRIRWCHDGLFIDTNCGQMFLTGDKEIDILKCYYGKDNDRYYLSLYGWKRCDSWRLQEYPDYVCNQDDCWDYRYFCPSCKERFQEEYNDYLKNVSDANLVIFLKEFDSNRPYEKRSK